MLQNINWHAVKRNIAITLSLMLISFFLWPAMLQTWPYIRPLNSFYAALMVFAECRLIPLKHFWLWALIAPFGIAGACFLGQVTFIDSSDATDFITFIAHIFSYGLFFLATSLPGAAIAFVQKRNKAGNSR